MATCSDLGEDATSEVDLVLDEVELQATQLRFGRKGAKHCFLGFAHVTQMFVWICSVKGHAVAAIDFLLVRWRRKAEKGAGSDAGEGASVRPP